MSCVRFRAMMSRKRYMCYLKHKGEDYVAKKLGISLLILSTIAFLSAFAIPFFIHSGGGMARWIAGLLIFSEVTFWTGGILLGKEVAKKYRSYLNPKNWKRKTVLNKQDKVSIQQDE